MWNAVVGFVVWDALLGSRTATPVPRGWVGFVPARGRGLLVGSWFVGRAWWFENWIVDASKYFCTCFCSFECMAPAWGRADRFVIICVMICRLGVQMSMGPCGWRARWRVFACKGVWWMPWQTGPMKDVAGCDKPRGAAKRALIRGFLNGETRRPSWAVTALCGGYAGK